MIEPVSSIGFQSNQEKVLEAMRGGSWMTLESVAATIGVKYPASVASRLRDFAANVDGEATLGKQWLYERRLVPNTKRVFEYRLFEVPASEQLDLLEA